MPGWASFAKIFDKEDQSIEILIAGCFRHFTFLHEAKPLKLPEAAIDSLPRFQSESD